MCQNGCASNARDSNFIAPFPQKPSLHVINIGVMCKLCYMNCMFKYSSLDSDGYNSVFLTGTIILTLYRNHFSLKFCKRHCSLYGLYTSTVKLTHICDVCAHSVDVADKTFLAAQHSHMLHSLNCN